MGLTNSLKLIVPRFGKSQARSDIINHFVVGERAITLHRRQGCLS
jgi:hypothetical protein